MKEKSKKNKKEKKSTKKILAIGNESGIKKVVCPDCNAFAIRGTIFTTNMKTSKMEIESGWQCPKCGNILKEIK